jgi:voltage-gated potassium channel
MKLKSRYIHKDNRFVILFLSLIATIILPALSLILSDGLTDVVSALCFSGIVVAGYIWDSEERKDHAVGLIFGAAAFFSLGARLTISQDDIWYLVHTVFALAFFNILQFKLLRAVFNSKEVNYGIIFGAISGYLILGIMGGFWMTLMDFVEPFSFHKSISHLPSYDYTYFSFVSMTTLGFGDILPQNPPAKAVVMLITILGQLYLSILIGLLIGKLMVNFQSKMKE